MDLESRRDLYNGFGDAMARGIEFVGTPFLFGLIGFLLDQRLGLTPVLTIALVLFAVTGTAIRAYYAYTAAMTRHEAEGPWARPRSPGLDRPGTDLPGTALPSPDQTVDDPMLRGA